MRKAWLAYQEAEDKLAWRTNKDDQQQLQEAVEQAWMEFEKALVDTARKA
jgi:hypothetical protein